MASNTVYDAIKARLDPVEGGSWSTTPIRWENDSLADPTDDHWIYVEMTGTLYAQMSIGAGAQTDNRFDEEGLLWIHVMAKTGIGTQTARQYAKQIADIFRGVTLLSGNLEFLDARIGRGVPGESDGQWWRLPIEIEWRRMEA